MKKLAQTAIGNKLKPVPWIFGAVRVNLVFESKVKKERKIHGFVKFPLGVRVVKLAQRASACARARMAAVVA